MSICIYGEQKCVKPLRRNIMRVKEKFFATNTRHIQMLKFIWVDSRFSFIQSMRCCIYYNIIMIFQTDGDILHMWLYIFMYPFRFYFCIFFYQFVGSDHVQLSIWCSALTIKHGFVRIDNVAKILGWWCSWICLYCLTFTQYKWNKNIPQQDLLLKSIPNFLYNIS